MIVKDLGLVNGPQGLRVVGIHASVTLVDQSGVVVQCPEYVLSDENELQGLSEELRGFWNGQQKASLKEAS